MAWFSRKKEDKSIIDTLAEYFKLGGSNGAITESQALQITAVFCAVRAISEGIAQMPLNIKKMSVEGDKVMRDIQHDHPVQRLISESPNSWMSAYEFWDHGTMMAALCGDFLAIKNVVRGQIKELLPLPNTAWRVEQNDDWTLRYSVSYADKTTDTFSSDQVFHVRGPSLDGFQGAKPVQLARQAINLEKNLESHQAALAKNGGRPSGVLSADNPLKPEQVERIRSTWNERFGSGGEGGVAVLDGGFKFTTMTMTSVDAQHLETRKHQIEEIARGFRVFPQMLMQTDKASTFASAEQFFRAHVIHTLGPWMKRIEGAIKRDLLTGEQGLYADFDERELLRGDFSDQAAYYSQALGAGGSPAWMTPNDVRADLKMNPIDGGDVLSVGAMAASNEEPSPTGPEEEE